MQPTRTSISPGEPQMDQRQRITKLLTNEPMIGCEESSCLVHDDSVSELLVSPAGGSHLAKKWVELAEGASGLEVTSVMTQEKKKEHLKSKEECLFTWNSAKLYEGDKSNGAKNASENMPPCVLATHKTSTQAAQISEEVSAKQEDRHQRRKPR